jgi:hypothetical protein
MYENGLSLPVDPVKNSELGVKALAAGKDLYSMKLAKDVTFKAAQNRANSLGAQAIWACLVDNQIAFADLVPSAVASYTNSNNFGIAYMVDGTWAVVDLASAGVAHVATEYEALALAFVGLSAALTTGSRPLVDTQAAVDAVLGARDTTDSLEKPTNTHVLGGGWLDLAATTFMQGTLLMVHKLSGDAYKRATITLKGLNMESMERTLFDMYRTLQVDHTLGWE